MARKAMTAAAARRPESTQCTCVCVCECLLCLSQPPEGRDPGYVVEVRSGLGPDRT